MFSFFAAAAAHCLVLLLLARSGFLPPAFYIFSQFGSAFVPSWKENL